MPAHCVTRACSTACSATATQTVDMRPWHAHSAGTSRGYTHEKRLCFPIVRLVPQEELAARAAEQVRRDDRRSVCDNALHPRHATEPVDERHLQIFSSGTRQHAPRTVQSAQLATLPLQSVSATTCGMECAAVTSCQAFGPHSLQQGPGLCSGHAVTALPAAVAPTLVRHPHCSCPGTHPSSHP